jgi:hypothetical protein
VGQTIISTRRNRTELIGKIKKEKNKRGIKKIKDRTDECMYIVRYNIHMHAY